MTQPSEVYVRESEFGGEILSAPKYYWGCCMVCRKVGTSREPLKRCAGCSCLFYCSKAHQTSHWKQHKRVCKYLAAAAEEVGADTFFGREFEPEALAAEEDEADVAEGSPAEVELETAPTEAPPAPDKASNWKTWAVFRTNAAHTAGIWLGRKEPLHEWEKEIFLFPRACRTCRLSKKEAMLDCTRCMSVTYCSPEHRDQNLHHHLNHFCSELKYAMVCDNYEATVSLAAPPIPPAIETRVIDEDKFLQGSMKPYLMHQVGWSKNSTLYKGEKKKMKEGEVDIDEMEFRFLSDRLTGPLTILYACLSVEDRLLANGLKITDVRDLTVHIVGSNVVEMLGIIKWEYLTHRLFHLEHCRIVFIGPEMDDHGETEEGECQGLGECQDCTDRGKCLVYEVRKVTYKKYCEDGKREGYYTVPDVVCAFNCGFHEFTDGGGYKRSAPAQNEQDTWKESLKYLVQHVNVPLLFTSYTLTEAHKDLNTFKDNVDVANIKFEKTAISNPFRSHRPVRDFEFDNDCDVFYCNQYLTVAKRIRE